jgi:hypothetical protein
LNVAVSYFVQLSKLKLYTQVKEEEDSRKQAKRTASGKSGGSSRSGKGKRARMSAAYLEDGTEYDETGLGSIKDDARNNR